jgi:hypothetical protein
MGRKPLDSEAFRCALRLAVPAFTVEIRPKAANAPEPLTFASGSVSGRSAPLGSLPSRESRENFEEFDRLQCFSWLPDPDVHWSCTPG